MNAMFLLCQCDSVVTKACGALIPVVQETYEAGTNCSDVCIVDVICRSIVIIVAILVAGFLAWKLIDHNAKENEREFNKKKEEEECKRKQTSDLIDKLLDFLKNKASENNDKKRQQAKKEGLSLTPQKIYDLLKGKAHESDSSELRKQYIELCVDIVQNLKSENTDIVKPEDNDPSQDQKNYDSIYINALCTLIGIYHKKEKSDDNIEDRKESCALETDNGNLNPESVKHEEKESKKS